MLVRSLAFALTASLILATLPVGAGSKNAETSDRSNGMQLMVFETKNCTYCDHFRYAVAPVYLNSEYAAKAPLTYVDVRQTDTSRLGLDAPITVAPTTVLTQNGREIARIAGVTGPDEFLAMVGHMMAAGH